jgi:dGTPase
MSGRLPFATYACYARQSQGRLYPTAPSPTRSAFQRDRDRIIHSTAFRRLAHKTQVFVPLDGDHFRTRLTHTIEVGQIARALARALNVDEDLAEAIALAHDVGHTPFGHAGEGALEACMAPYGGFDHNAQALRIVTKLERRYAEYDGLNLSWETLEGIVKHNGPLKGATAKRPLAKYIAEFDHIFPLDLHSYASLEAQAAALADDIAYIGHDIDDGLRAGLFSINHLTQRVSFIDKIHKEIIDQYPQLEKQRVIHEIVRRLITRLVEDAIYHSANNLAIEQPQTAHEVRMLGRAMVSFSSEISTVEQEIKKFLFNHMYRHEQVMGVWEQARLSISCLFKAFMDSPSKMPPDWFLISQSNDDIAKAITVADYIAGMTDRFALDEARRLFPHDAGLFQGSRKSR